jgi:hypothetical protein
MDPVLISCDLHADGHRLIRNIVAKIYKRLIQDLSLKNLQNDSFSRISFLKIRFKKAGGG